MTSKDKLIGIALILIGIGFIALGVVFGMKPATTTNNNQVYTEQQNGNAETQNDELEPEVQNPVDVYEENINVDGPSNYVEVDEQENNTTEQDDEGSTRYIY